MYASPIIIKVNKYIGNGMGGVYVTCGGQELPTGLYWGNLREKDRLEDLGIEERTLFNWILRRDDGRALSGLMWLRIETCDGLL